MKTPKNLKITPSPGFARVREQGGGAGYFQGIGLITRQKKAETKAMKQEMGGRALRNL